MQKCVGNGKKKEQEDSKKKEEKCELERDN